MPTKILKLAFLLTLLTTVQSMSAPAQQAPQSGREAMIRALLFVRGTASEELRAMPAADITVDASRLPNVTSSVSNSEVAALGNQLRMHVVPGLEAKCARAGVGLTRSQALFARAECVTIDSRYYVEAQQLEASGDTVIVVVHVFRMPMQPDRPHTSRIDYAGYKVELLRQANGWGKARLVSITET